VHRGASALPRKRVCRSSAKSLRAARSWR
jgi:hypothetical protein